ncbi:hypothetical protein CRYUN_Cryun39dG0013200 [Craigia yunnanensis]
MGSKVFENLEADDLVKMMMKLVLCYEQDPSDPNSLLLIPSILEEGRGKPQKRQLSGADCLYAGRHLQCDDSRHMVELGGQLGYYIDILARSTKNLTETLRLTQQFIIPAIQSLCHGVTLIENIMRPECVQNLIPPRYRKSQFVPLQQLKQALLSVPAESMYDYQHTWDSVSDSGRSILRAQFDLDRDLLSDDDFREVLHRRYHDLLLIELHRKVNYLVNFTVQIKGRKVPNMFYFVRTENYSRRLVTNIISGMTALWLHMLCEFRREMHVVEDQVGCEVKHIDNRAVKFLAPYMTKFMKLVTFALKIGAHLAAGMGNMILNLSREVAHLADSFIMYGTAGTVAAGAALTAAIGRLNGIQNRNKTGDIQQDLRSAQQWVVDLLRDRRCSTGKDIADKFGLWRLRYRDDEHIAWICRRQMTIRANEITEVPI